VPSCRDGKDGTSPHAGQITGITLARNPLWSHPWRYVKIVDNTCSEYRVPYHDIRYFTSMCVLSLEQTFAFRRPSSTAHPKHNSDIIYTTVITTQNIL
jgi:hypothetical protein